MRAGTEIRSLTGLRGVAAIYVILLHYFIPTGASRSALTVFILHGYLSVDLFFILSGFVMALNYSHMFAVGFSREHYRKFLGRRIARIYPLYLATLIIAAMLMMFRLLERPQTLLFNNFLLNALMVQSWWGSATSFDPPAWSLSTEWAAYILFPLLLIPTLMRGAGPAVTSAIAAAIVLAVLAALPPPYRKLTNPLTLLDFHNAYLALAVWRCVADFTLGLVAFRVAGSSIGPIIGERRWMTEGICIVIFVMLFIRDTDLLIVFSLPVLLVAIAFGHSLPQRLLSTTFGEYAGRLSYSLYLTHDLMGGLMGWVHRHVTALGLSHGQTVAAAVGILLTIPTSILLYAGIEVPGRRALRFLFEGRSSLGLKSTDITVKKAPVK